MYVKKEFIFQDPSQGFLFGDSGYANSPILITPFPNPSNAQEMKFNKAHKSIRSKVERSIGMLKNRWYCLHHSGGALQYDPPTCVSIMHTCVLLENLCIKLGLEDPEDISDEEEGNDVDGPQVNEGQNPNQTRLGAIRRRDIMIELSE